MRVVDFVKFVDTLEEPEAQTPEFGLLFEDGSVFCFCCGGTVEAEDVKVLEKYGVGRLSYVNEYLKLDF